MTLMIENINNDISLCPAGRPEATPNGSYYRFYQSKLRQLLTQTRYRKEQEARVARQKQLKTSLIDSRIPEQKFHKEYMNHIRERSKMQTQEILLNKTDDQKKGSDSVISNSIRTVTLSITSTNILTTMESRPKTISKTKQIPISPPKQQRIISAPTSRQRNRNRSKLIPTIKIDSIDESSSKANIDSFTQASSSSQNQNNINYQQARQSVLNTIMIHLNSHIPTSVSKWPTYEDIDNKFSSSIAPTVYRDFERIID